MLSYAIRDSRSDPNHTTQAFQEGVAICIVIKDVFPGIAPGRHMVGRAVKLQPKRACHDRCMCHAAGREDKVQNLTLLLLLTISAIFNCFAGSSGRLRDRNTIAAGFGNQERRRSNNDATTPQAVVTAIESLLSFLKTDGKIRFHDIPSMERLRRADIVVTHECPEPLDLFSGDFDGIVQNGPYDTLIAGRSGE